MPIYRSVYRRVGYRLNALTFQIHSHSSYRLQRSLIILGASIYMPNVRGEINHYAYVVYSLFHQPSGGNVINSIRNGMSYHKNSMGTLHIDKHKG